MKLFVLVARAPGIFLWLSLPLGERKQVRERWVPLEVASDAGLLFWAVLCAHSHSQWIFLLYCQGDNHRGNVRLWGPQRPWPYTLIPSLDFRLIVPDMAP